MASTDKKILLAINSETYTLLKEKLEHLKSVRHKPTMTSVINELLLEAVSKDRNWQADLQSTNLNTASN